MPSIRARKEIAAAGRILRPTLGSIVVSVEYLDPGQMGSLLSARQLYAGSAVEAMRCRTFPPCATFRREHVQQRVCTLRRYSNT
jgi:hypothetical protein